MQAFICRCRSTCYSSFPEGVKPPGPFCSLSSCICISWKALASVYGAHLALSLARTCPELSMTTSCAGHFPYFRCPALRNNHRSEQACAPLPPSHVPEQLCPPSNPHHTPSRACGWHFRQKWSVLLQGDSFIGVMLSIFASIKDC